MKRELASKLLTFVLFSVILLTSPVNVTGQESQSYVILIDDNHEQFINSSLLTSAINDLEELTGVTVITSSEDFSNATLTGVDVIIIPNPGESAFDSNELIALSQWVTQGDKGLILLANPLFEDNDSLNGNIHSHNTLLTEVGLNPNTFVSSESDANEPVSVQNLEAIDKSYISFENVTPSIIPSNNTPIEISTISTTLKIFPSESILSAGFSSFVLNKNGLYSSFAVDNYLFGAIEKDANRYVLGGSTIMFSDLINPDTSLPWYDTADNDVFWKNLVKYALDLKQSDIHINKSGENIYSILFPSIIIGSIFIILGTFLYLTGKEIKLFDSTLVSTSSQIENLQKDDKSPLSKSQKKLQQRSKNKK